MPSNDTEELPESLAIEIGINGEQLTEIAVTIEGDTPTGYVDATITSTFSNLGEPQTIEAPPQDQVTAFNEDALFEALPAVMQDAIAVMEELEQRRPGLCEDQIPAFSHEPPDPNEFVASYGPVIACLDDAGEPEAAEAMRSLVAEGLLVIPADAG